MIEIFRGLCRPQIWLQIAAVSLGSLPSAVLGGVDMPPPAAEVEPVCRRALAAGTEFLRQERYRDARESFAEVARSCPDDASGWRGLGQSEGRLGAAAAAAEAFRRALQLSPADLDLLQFLADAEAAQAGANRAAADSALILYDLVLRKDPARVAAYGAAAEVCARLSDLPGAIALRMQQRTASGVSPGDAWPAALGRECLNAKLYSEAERIYRDCVARDSTDLESRRVLASLDIRLGRWAAAARGYEAILGREPQGSSAVREEERLAECLLQLGRFAEAAEHWGRLAAFAPGLERYRCEETAAWLRAGDPERARGIAADALAIHPDWSCLRDRRAEAEERLRGAPASDGAGEAASWGVRR